MKGYCINDSARIGQDEQSGLINIQELVGAKVHIISVTMQNCNYHGTSKDVYTVGNIYFRVTLDGKCHTLVSLAEIPEMTFKLTDLEFVEL